MKIWVNGDVLYAEPLNDNFSSILRSALQNHVRDLINNDGVYSADGTDLYGEAYTDADGRNESVDTGDTTSSFYTNKYVPTWSISSLSEGSISNNERAANNLRNKYEYTGASDFWIPKTVRVFGGVSHSATMTLSLYKNGSLLKTTSVVGEQTTLDVTELGILSSSDYFEVLFNFSTTPYTSSSFTQDDVISTTNIDITAVSFRGITTNGYTAITFDVITSYSATPTVVYHDIPTGTFPATISTAILSAVVGDWETGASIDYKLTNSTEDTGWLTINEISSFTAFTSEPTKCIVRLTPKSSSPTAGYPSILGVTYRAE